jgi:hypothetical protein
MRSLLIVATACLLLCAGPAFAQVDDPTADPLMATPSLGVTSPLGMGPQGSVGATGIPLGATEITSSGVSPAPTVGVTGTIAVPGSGEISTSGATCSTAGASPSGMYGSTATYDGGGTAAGSAAPATAGTAGSTAMSGTIATSGTSPSSATPVTSELPVTMGSAGVLDTSGMSGMCGSGSSSIAASSSPTSTSPTTPGGGARTGIPFGAFEIGNLGVSSAPAVPVPSVLPVVGTVGPSSLVPTMPTASPTTSPTATSSNPACATTGSNLGPGNFAGEGNAGVQGTSITAQLLRKFILCQRP